MYSLILAIFLLNSAIIAHASPVGSILPSAEQRGEATFRFLGIPMYKARLYTDGGRAFDWQQDFALDLTYQRNLTEYDLVVSTLREINQLGQTPTVRDQLIRCFDDVASGDSYLAVTDRADRIVLWRNGRSVCISSHPQIKRYFMSIFLDENTRSAKFTRNLRGL